MKVRFLIIAAFLLLAGCADKTPPKPDPLLNAIHRSAGYLARSVGKDGKFLYRINLNPTVKPDEKYNILRHGGSIFSMVSYYEIHPNPEMLRAIEQAGRYLQKEAFAPVPGEKDTLAIWSKPEVNHTGEPLQAKLGGTGIGLVGLLSIEKIHPGFTPIDDLRKLGQFVVMMQKENGSFYSKYIPEEGGRWDKWESLYYPGEAALGLAMLHEIDPSGTWLKTASRALEYLAQKRENSDKVPADHWTLLATEKVLALKVGEKGDLRERLVKHAIQICEAILKDFVESPSAPIYDGGFSLDGRTTPAATRLEGLQASLSFLPKNSPIRSRVEAVIPKGIAFLQKAQIIGGEYSGAIPRAVAVIPGSSPDSKQFNRRSSEVRIDYVQHALSAMIQYLDLRS